MKNTIESDAKVSALESVPFIPSEVERLESLSDSELETLARDTGLLPAETPAPFVPPSGVAGDLFRMFASTYREAYPAS